VKPKGFTCSQALSLYYECIEHKIKADDVADRGKQDRVLMSDFIWKYFSTKFGISSISDSFTAGLAHASKKYQSKSLRMSIFASLVGMTEGEDWNFSSRHSDILLNLLQALLSSEEENRKYCRADFENYPEGERKVAVNKAVAAVEFVFRNSPEPFKVGSVYLLPERKKKIMDFLAFIIDKTSVDGDKKIDHRATSAIMTDMDSLLSMCHKLWAEQLQYDAETFTAMLSDQSGISSISEDKFVSLVEQIVACNTSLCDFPKTKIHRTYHKIWKLAKKMKVVEATPEIIATVLVNAGLSPKGNDGKS